jgi:ketosteroid isomerase-like protein
MKKIILSQCLLLLFLIFGCENNPQVTTSDKELAIDLVNKMAESWKIGDAQLLFDILHEDAVFAYPGRRLNKDQTIDDLLYFRENFKDTQVYINQIIVDGNNVAVEWQFATTKIDTGQRQVVSDAIIGKLKDGKILIWKEYLDGRVKLKQAAGELAYEEGLEPFPWPNKIN